MQEPVPIRPSLAAVRRAFSLRDLPRRGMGGRPKGRCVACGKEVREPELFVRLGDFIAHAECGVDPHAPRGAVL
jgi:hypothetical protein